MEDSIVPKKPEDKIVEELMDPDTDIVDTVPSESTPRTVPQEQPQIQQPPTQAQTPQQSVPQYPPQQPQPTTHQKTSRFYISKKMFISLIILGLVAFVIYYFLWMYIQEIYSVAMQTGMGAQV